MMVLSSRYCFEYERVHNGSYHDDIVQLSHDIYRGYMPMYGNDTITGPSTQ